ncbi:MAG TPA: signal peptidase I [Frankiaceae bacterium]|nr:signal peptidase I [Frankiaceae bacterium]
MDVMNDVAAVPPDLDDEEPEKRAISKELWFLLLVALGLALLMKTFLIQAFFIPSGSMEQTLHGCANCTGDRVLVNKLVYKFRDIHRGEIVVFNGKDTDFSGDIVLPPPKNLYDRVNREVKRAIGAAPGERDFIKRVIGVPGDVVACCTDGRLTINGQPIDESAYVFLSHDTELQPFDPVTVPEGHLWLMGDHRDGSQDSRANGPVPIKNVVGRAFAVFWPIRSSTVADQDNRNRLKILRVPEVFDAKSSALPPAPAGAAHAPEVLGLAVAVPVTVVRRRLRAGTD